MIKEVVDQLQKVVTGLERGVSAAMEALPLLVRQEISARAQNKLDSTYQEYMNAVSVGYEGSILVVELDSQSKLANMLELGADAFSMKEGHLQSPKAKTSAQGWKYISIPIPQTKTGRKAKTESGQAIQDKIRAALERPSFGAPKVSVRPDGTVSSTEKLLTDDPSVKGLYRVRKYGQADAFRAGDRPLSSQFVLFRTISNRPDAKGQWQHPGFRPLNIFRDVESWGRTSLPDILSEIIDKAVAEALKS
jgi:hypothetical protein